MNSGAMKNQPSSGRHQERDRSCSSDNKQQCARTVKTIFPDFGHPSRPIIEKWIAQDAVSSLRPKSCAAIADTILLPIESATYQNGRSILLGGKRSRRSGPFPGPHILETWFW